MIEAECAAGERVIAETPGYIVFHPFASRVPFETWILPKIFRPAFGHVTLEELKESAKYCCRLWHLWQRSWTIPITTSYYTPPRLRTKTRSTFLWHLRIIPRLTQLAGFEIGSGMLINIFRPEETARLLRGQI